MPRGYVKLFSVKALACCTTARPRCVQTSTYTKAFAERVVWQDAQVLIQVADPAKLASILFQLETTWAEGYEPAGKQAPAVPSPEHGGYDAATGAPQKGRFHRGMRPKSGLRFSELCCEPDSPLSDTAEEEGLGGNVGHTE